MLPAPALSAARRAALESYVSEVRAFLRLSHWTLALLDEWPDDEECLAQIDPSEQRYWANVRLGPGFWDQSPEQVRNTIVHELVHLHHVRVTDVTRLGQWRQQVGQALYDHVIDQVKR